MHEGAEAIFPGVISLRVYCELTDDEQEVFLLLVLESSSDVENESLDELEHIFVLVFKPGRQEVGHVDYDTLLWSQVVLESRLTFASVLNFSSQA